MNQYLIGKKNSDKLTSTITRKLRQMPETFIPYNDLSFARENNESSEEEEEEENWEENFENESNQN